MTEPIAPILNFAHLYPELLLFGFSLVLMALAIIRPTINIKIIGYSVMGIFAVTGALVANTNYGIVYGDLFINEYSSQFFKYIFIAIGFFAAAIRTYDSKENSRAGIFQFVLIMLSVLAMMYLSMAGNLISLFASLELCTLPVLLIVVLENNSADKSAPKFLLILIISALLILFGLGFLFGLSGNVNLLQMKLQIAIVHLTRREIGVIILLSVAAILSGLMLKASIPPFHKWSRALHESLPLSIVLFISFAVPIAVLAAFSKLFINGLFAFYGPEMNPNDWGRIVAFIAFSSILFGTVQMLRQKEMISLMYYANIVQIGFILTGLVSMNQYGLQSAAFYIVAFLLALSGIYAVTTLIRSKFNQTNLTDFAGLFNSSKLTAILLAIFLMSLAGLPLTAGFVAKFSVIEAAIAMATVDRAYHWMFILTGAAGICAAVGFIKLARISYSLFRKSESASAPLKIPTPILIVILIAALGTIAIGILPDPLLDYLSRISQAFGFIVE